MLKNPDNIYDYLQCNPIPAGETGWGFGQIFLIFMLILPLMSFLEAYENEKESRQRPKPSINCSAMSSPMLVRHKRREDE
jgi:hypothetical protein